MEPSEMTLIDRVPFWLSSASCLREQATPTKHNHHWQTCIWTLSNVCLPTFVWTRIAGRLNCPNSPFARSYTAPNHCEGYMLPCMPIFQLISTIPQLPFQAFRGNISAELLRYSREGLGTWRGGVRRFGLKRTRLFNNLGPEE